MNHLATMRRAAGLISCVYLMGLTFLLIGGAGKVCVGLFRGRENVLKSVAAEMFYASLNFLFIAVAVLIVIMVALVICTLIDVIRKYLK